MTPLTRNLPLHGLLFDLVVLIRESLRSSALVGVGLGLPRKSVGLGVDASEPVDGLLYDIDLAAIDEKGCDDMMRGLLQLVKVPVKHRGRLLGHGKAGMEVEQSSTVEIGHATSVDAVVESVAAVVCVL